MSNLASTLMNMPDPQKQLGYPPALDSDDLKRREELRISLILATQGVSLLGLPSNDSLVETSVIAKDLIQNYREKVRLLSGMLCPPATRIVSFINQHFAEFPEQLKQVSFPDALVLSAHGLARSLSFPIGSNMFEGEICKSYRLANQGVLHNPLNDKRTTEGSFHIAEGGLPITADKYRVPKQVFLNMLVQALQPPKKLNVVPYTSGTPSETSMMLSLLLRPMVCPAIPGVAPSKSMEIYCLAPGNLVSCLDFVESVFGNAGDPFLPENDAALDVEQWVGVTGLLLLAPHLTKCKKKDLGLPHWDQATPLQREQGMCWKDEKECYNGGRAFKCTARTADGVVLTIVGDNYFGYCKKEVKTQITYAANIMGMSEEEHAGGTLAFPRYYDGMNLDAGLEAKRWSAMAGYTFEKAMKLLEHQVELKEGGYAIDKTYGEKLTYVPETANFSLLSNSVTWKDKGGKEVSISLSPDRTYVLPSGYKVHVEHHPTAQEWRLICTDAHGTFLHKPCTVSGGGKSELSKSIAGGMLYGPLFINDPQKDFDLVDEILNFDVSSRFSIKESVDFEDGIGDEMILSPKVSLGGVIKILTHSRSYTKEYNEWLKKFPLHVFQIVFSVKRFYKEEWGKNWRSHFSMDLINGMPGHELKFDNRKIISGFLRVGYTSEGGMWRTYKTRIDYVPCAKVQLEDDISCSVVVPRKWLPKQSIHPMEENQSPTLHKKSGDMTLLLTPQCEPTSLKLVTNCEFRLFQRPDDCIYRGDDTQTEKDLSEPGNFIANFEPLKGADIKKIVENVCNFELFSKPMQTFLQNAANISEDSYVVCSSNTRLVAGKPTKNPRYLQIRPDAIDHMDTYLAAVGTRLVNCIPKELPVIYTVDLLFLGRRISPPGPGLPNLCVYNPMHYQEFPELFMDIICSVSGTSPSTTGAGSEGALTKGPFNNLPFTADLNNFLLSCALSGLGGWSTPTGNIGPKTQFAHDISLVIPEVWCRMKAYERDPLYLIQRGYLEKVNDFEHKGRTVYASRLGYRITEKFADFFGHVFDFPKVFEEHMLRPELQDLDGFVDGVDSVIQVQKVVAKKYFDDGTVELASPPIKALLHIMYHGKYEGKGINDPEVRSLFLRDNILRSDWYNERILEQQKRDTDLWTRHVKTLTDYISAPHNDEPSNRLNLKGRLEFSKKQLEKVSKEGYRNELVGSICADLLPRVQQKKRESNKMKDKNDQICREFIERLVKYSNLRTVDYKGGAQYKGQITDAGVKQGLGSYFFANGDMYLGEFKRDIFEGNGIYIFHQGDRYQGEIKSGLKSGKGIYYYNNGNYYDGDWLFDKKNGLGEYYYNNTYEKYFGEWKNGKRDGKGKFFFAYGDVYDGEWKEDMKQGFGTLHYKNGTVYEGQWASDRANGHGTMVFENGNKYEGEWLDGVKSGPGKYTFTDGTIYEGDWLNDEKNGKGVLFLSNGDVYDGEWLDGEKSSQGTYSYKNGDVYSGEWKNDKRDGNGCFILADGDKYYGEWFEGNKHGKGTYYFKNGDKYEGYWLNGVRNGKGIYMWSNGISYNGEWKNDSIWGKGEYFDGRGESLALR